VSEPALTLADAVRIIAQAVKDKSYRASEVGQLVGRYIRWLRNEWGATPSTIRDYEAILARMSLHLGDKQPIEVDIEDLRAVIDLWADREPRTRQKVTSVIRSFWNWAEEEGLVPFSPAAKLRRPRAPKKVAPLLPHKADEALMKAATLPRDRVGLACLLWLGVRREELAKIQVRHFDVGRQTLTVYGKGRKERVLPLRGQILDELTVYMQSPLPGVGRPPEPDDFLLYPIRKQFGRQGSEGQQTLNLRGEPKKQPSSQSVHRWWYKRLEAGGFVGPGVTKGLNMHLARHTFATELRRAAGIDAASQALGHSDISTTAGIYGHHDASDLERAMDAYWQGKEEDSET
jgi:integrase/recombinase XerD